MNRLTRLHNTQTSGFSLLELLVTIAVLGVLMTMGLPQLNTFLKNSRMTTQTNTLVSVINFARSEAITRNQNIFITALNATDASNEWGQGWQVWVDGLQTNGCRGNVTAGQPNSPNRALENNPAGCNEVLKIFDFSGSQVTIDMGGTFAVSAAQVTGDLTTNTLMFRGGSGLPALNAGTNAINFTLCDDRQAERGRLISINRVTGRVTLLNDAHQCS